MHLPPDITYRFVAFDDVVQHPWEDVLSPEERARLGEWKHEKRRREFTAGRMAARLLLAERLRMSPADVPILVAGSGALRLDGHDLYVSISHAAGRAVAAVGERPLGVDLEAIKPRRPDLHRFILHTEEYDLLERLPLPRDEALILCWTLKEAVLKASTTGFRCSPKSLRLAVDPHAETATIHAADQPDWQAAFSRVEDSFMAVAYRP